VIEFDGVNCEAILGGGHPDHFYATKAKMYTWKYGDARHAWQEMKTT
jgi:hypothetical protein